MPSNEGRGYVLRRIMRRAMRHAQLLGARDPLMHRLVPILVREMGRAYPEIVRAETLAAETLLLEETRFRRTLERGLSILEEESAGLQAGASFPGEVAFKLYDTYGFPLDLTRMRSATGASRWIPRCSTPPWPGRRPRRGPIGPVPARRPPTPSGSAFATGWGPRNSSATIPRAPKRAVRALVRDGAEVSSLAAGTRGLLVLNQTPFYGESGGQVGDTGLMTGEGVRVQVLNTQKKLGDVFVHEVEVLEGTLSLECAAGAGGGSRPPVRRACQPFRHPPAARSAAPGAGRPCGPEGLAGGRRPAALRLQPPKPLSAEELAQVEDIANTYVLRNEPVETRLMGVDDAVASGARALFGEKYGEEVRVVSMGTDPGNHAPYSVELCGGTHVARTGDIGWSRCWAIAASPPACAGWRR